MKKIDHIKIKIMDDDYPDLSGLGEYSDTPKEGAIDRREYFGSSWRVGEYKYFNPGNYDPTDPDRDEYALQDYERMEAYNHGDWRCIGIRADCKYLIDNWIIQEITSGGLWGIESDSGDDYLKEIAQEETFSLTIYLKEIGFTDKEIEPHIKKALQDFEDDL
jgi:hypothetical protein